jgi:hypothetical protein
MKTHVQSITYSLLTALLLTAGQAQAALDSASTSRLQTLETQPELAGALIYRGTTYALAEPDGQPLFRYERRLLTVPTGLTAAHLTRNPEGQLLIAETAQASDDYQLQRFTTQNRQSGFSGAVEVSGDGRTLHYLLNDNGDVSRAEESLDAPAVTGPTLHGFILSHWSQLQDGQEVPIRFVVLKEKQTYGFSVRLEQHSASETSFTITPSNLLIRWFIAPLQVVFDNERKTVLRYTGRVPPLHEVDGSLQDLDARVEYESVAARYR